MSNKQPKRPEHNGSASDYYDRDGAQKYHGSYTTQITQEELTQCALELLHLPAGPHLVLDLGCGSGLSSAVLTAHGHTWLGTDVSLDMLRLLSTRQPSTLEKGEAGSGGPPGNTWLGDLGHGLPLRGARFDAAVSISVVQWLARRSASAGPAPAAGAGEDAAAQGRLHRFFASLHSCLASDAPAVLQVYPETPAEGALLAGAAGACGFAAHLVLHFPHRHAHNARSRKFFLCLRKCSASLPPHPSPHPPPAGVGDAPLCPLSFPYSSTCARWWDAQCGARGAGGPCGAGEGAAALAREHERLRGRLLRLLRRAFLSDPLPLPSPPAPPLTPASHATHTTPGPDTTETGIEGSGEGACMLDAAGAAEVPKQGRQRPQECAQPKAEPRKAQKRGKKHSTATRPAPLPFELLHVGGTWTRAMAPSGASTAPAEDFLLRSSTACCSSIALNVRASRASAEDAGTTESAASELEHWRQAIARHIAQSLHTSLAQNCAADIGPIRQQSSPLEGSQTQAAQTPSVRSSKIDTEQAHCSGYLLRASDLPTYFILQANYQAGCEGRSVTAAPPVMSCVADVLAEHRLQVLTVDTEACVVPMQSGMAHGDACQAVTRGDTHGDTTHKASMHIHVNVRFICCHSDCWMLDRSSPPTIPCEHGSGEPAMGAGTRDIDRGALLQSVLTSLDAICKSSQADR